VGAIVATSTGDTIGVNVWLGACVFVAVEVGVNDAVGEGVNEGGRVSVSVGR
jgi:hypothetical protein